MSDYGYDFLCAFKPQTSSQLCNEIQHLREYLLGQNVTVIVSQFGSVPLKRKDDEQGERHMC